MFQPGTLALMLVLAGAVAGAQPSAGPVLRKRSLTVTGNPSEPVPEVRGAKGLGITFHFDGPTLEESVRVDAARVRVVDVGKRSLLVEPLVALQAEAPTEVSVVYEQGEPRRATFVLVAHPSEVDVWVEVTRRMRQPEEACQARLYEVRASCGAHSPTAFRRSGLLTAAGIQAQEFRGSERNAGHLVPEQGVFFLGKTWALVESNVLPFPPPQPPGLAGRLALRVRALASRGLRWHKGLALGSAGATLGLTALLALLALWPQAEQPPAFPAPEPAATAPAPAGSKPSQGPALAPAPDAPAALEKKGSPVMTQKPDAPLPPPTPRPQKPQRGAHTAEFLGWCKSFAILGTVTAVASGCPGAQVRPEPFQCPEGAWELMDEKWQWDNGDGIAVRIDDRHPVGKSAWYQSGPVVGVVDRDEPEQERSKKPVPKGTRFIGHLWLVPEPTRFGDPGYFVVRYDRVELPNGENAPVCLLVGRNLDHGLDELKDGSGRISQPTHRAVPVYRWKPKRSE